MGKKVLKQLNEAVEYLKKKYKHQPEVGIVLGSGLGKFTEEIEIEIRLGYQGQDVPVLRIDRNHGAVIRIEQLLRI